MLRRLIIITAILTFLSAALCINSTYGKYTMRVNVGSLQISVVKKERRSHLSDSNELNFIFRIGSFSKVVFGSYDKYPQMRGAIGFDIGDYDESATDADRVKLHFGTDNTAYILSENVIYASSMEGMFKNCNWLRSVKFSNFDVSDVKSMKELFYNCDSLTEVIFDFDVRKTQDMSRMFYKCRSLESLDLSRFDTSDVTNMDEMFEGCRRLRSIYVSELWSTKNVRAGTDMFKNCVRLRGGNGTKYNERQISFAMARIDKDGSPGYLNSKSSI